MHWSYKNTVVSVLLFVVLFVPTLLIGLYYYQAIDSSMTNQVFTQRETVASLSASAISLKLTKLVALDQKYASDTDIIQNVAAGNWGAAESAVINLEKNPLDYNYYIDRISLLDASGTVESIFPGIAASGTGQLDEAVNEWYAPIIEDGATSYVSNVYQREVSPTTNLIEILVPVKSGSRDLGLVELDIPINEFSDFGKDVDVGSDGFAYFVDRAGHIISHPKYSSAGSIIDYSSLPAVQDVMQGKSGVGIFYNPFEQQLRVVAYESVPLYGWGVLAQEPVNEAFAPRDGILMSILYLIIAVSIIELIAAVMIGLLFAHRHSLERKHEGESGFTLIELLVVIAIIAILSVVVLLTVNPAELLKQSRDSDRISDMSTLRTAVALYLTTVTIPNLASSSFGYSACYLSSYSGAANGTTSAYCGMFVVTGSSTDASTTKLSNRNIDSTGWVPINFSQISGGTPFGSLPVDPTNNPSYYYAYAASSTGIFEFGTVIESQRYRAGGSNSVVTTGSILQVGSVGIL